MARKAVCIYEVPVPQTDTGGQVEQTKASEITVVKELCKIAPQVSDKERSPPGEPQ